MVITNSNMHTLQIVLLVPFIRAGINSTEYTTSQSNGLETYVPDKPVKVITQMHVLFYLFFKVNATLQPQKTDN